jgi:GDP-4-dehydro-6-deoxy-D-mannose reductase
VNAVITGVTGFAGSYLAEHLLAEGDCLLGCSRRGTWPAFVPKSLPPAVPLLAWDLGHSAIGESAESQIASFRPDCIYHLAGISVPGECGEQLPSPRAAAVNLGGASAILELAARLPRKPRVLFVSSSHVYDRQQASLGPLNERSPIAPRRGYGWSKWLAESMSVSFARQQGIELIVARAFQHAGPRQLPRMMLPDWTQQFVGIGSCPVGDSNPVRVHNLSTTIDLTDVRDVVRAYRRLIEQGRPGEVYNVGSGLARQTGEVFERLRAVAGQNCRVMELYPGIQHDPVADISQLAACTHWRPIISLDQTLADTLNFWRQHKVNLQDTV